MAKNPVLDKEIRAKLEGVIALGTYTYLRSFTKDLFTDFRTAQSQDCVVAGLVGAVQRYEKTTGRPIARSLALALLDTTKE